MIIMSPAGFKIVISMVGLLSGSMIFDRIPIMIQGFEIAGFKFTKGCMFFQGASRCIPC